MTVHIDGIIFSIQKSGGISVYFKELLRRAAEQSMANVLLTLEAPLSQRLEQQSSEFLRIDSRDARFLERYRSCRPPGAKASVFVSSYYRTPAESTCPNVVVVHDFIYERYSKGPKLWLHSAQKRNAIEKANSIICISESTRNDLLKFCRVRSDQEIYVIHNGASDHFSPVVSEAPTKRFALYVGLRGGYKNFKLAAEALSHVDDLELWCVGGGAISPAELNTLSPEVRDRVRHLGFVADEQLNTLYNQAFCLIYPSEYEGFGIPVIEAMRAGCPVVSVKCDAVIEAGGDALVVAESVTAKAIAAAVKLLDSPAYRQEIKLSGLTRSQRFTWDRAHKQTLQVLQNYE